MKSQQTTHYHSKSCNIEIRIILKQVYENPEYHKKRFHKVLKQGILGVHVMSSCSKIQS